MKKIVFFSLIGSIFLLTSCGISTSENAVSSSSSMTKSSKMSSTTNGTSTTKESSTTLEETVSGTQTSQNQKSENLTETPQESSETATSTTSTTTNNEQPVFTPDQEQALQILYNNKPELKDPDISFAFFKMIGSDYLFKATSVSIRQQGGSGTIGFYRVSLQGTVTETDPSGNPY